MTKASQFAGYAARVRGFIQDDMAGSPPSPASDFEGVFSRLALDLFALQFACNPSYRKLCDARAVSPDTVRDWCEIPAVPTNAFKEFDLTSLPPSKRIAVFHSSGTTEQRPSRHFHDAESLALYKVSLLSWFQCHLLPETAVGADVAPSADNKAVVLSLTPNPHLAPHSSLVHMFETIRSTFGSPDSTFVGKLDQSAAWDIDLAGLEKALSSARSSERPVLLLGTAFNFVRLLDDVASVDTELPPGSSVLETGGYKGRSRAMPKTELHQLIAQRFGVSPSSIVTEYGMSELSSQAYDWIAGGSHLAGRVQRVFQFPPWARAQVVSPESGREVSEGETGLLRVFDLANVRSVLAVQTEDLAVRRGNGFELLGRAVHAEPRGCSLMSV